MLELLESQRSDSIGMSSIRIDSNDTSALVAPPKNDFRSSWKPDKNYTSVAIYKSKGVNSQLSKTLAKSTTAVKQRVYSARSSFQSVDRIINGPGLDVFADASEREALLLDWQDIKNVRAVSLVSVPDRLTG